MNYILLYSSFMHLQVHLQLLVVSACFFINIFSILIVYGSHSCSVYCLGTVTSVPWFSRAPGLVSFVSGSFVCSFFVGRPWKQWLVC